MPNHLSPVNQARAEDRGRAFRLHELMRQELPDNMPAALRWYFDLERAARDRGGERAWEAVEAWLGLQDLFYLLAVILNRPDVLKPWLFDRCREVQASPDNHLDLWARDHYKDQACATPVLTANRSWVQHGDLVPGDMVFAPNGKQVRVLAVTPHFADSECYKLTFSDGASIIAGAGHQWRIREKYRKRIYGTERRHVLFENRIVTTAQMARGGGRYDVGVCEPLEYPEADLPLDPYVLGVWLGDGHSACVRITAASSDADAIEMALTATGVAVARSVPRNGAVLLRLGTGIRGKRTSSDVATALRSLGVMNNKHIPQMYLTASVSQRMALLQGLMDTDGHCDKLRGTATFVQVDAVLAQQVYELATSLGLKPRLRKHRGIGLNHFYHVSFQAHKDRNPFRMPRKAVRAIPPSHYRGCRTLANIERVSSVPTNCIQVEGGLYCSGIEHVPTHNSTIITFGLTIQEVLRDPELTVGIFSHTSDIARAFLRQIKQELESNARLYQLYPDALYQWPAKESPKWSERDGIIIRRKSNPKEATIEGWGLVDGQPTSKHFRLRVYDDVVTRESVQTPEAIQKTTQAWELSDNLGVSEDRGGRVRYIGTRYSLYDTYSTMLVRKAVKVRLHAATHNGRFDGKPVFLSEKVWQEKLRRQGRATVAAQLLQNPMADEGSSFRPEWLRAYEVRPRTLNVYIMCDPSLGRSSSSDNTAIAVVGIGAGGAKYLLDGACHRMPLSERWLYLRGFYRRWSAVRGVQRVSVGYERYGAQADTDYFQEQMQIDYRKRIPNPYFMIEELNWPREGGNSKQERVERLEPDFRNGRFFLPLSVMHEGKPARWRVDSDPSSNTFGVIEYMPGAQLTSRQMQAIEGGSPDLVCRPIIQRDPQTPAPRAGGGRYDVTAAFMDEYMLFPFGQFKDMIDATSRIYDMDPVAPMAPSAMTSQDPEVYADGM